MNSPDCENRTGACIPAIRLHSDDSVLVLTAPAKAGDCACIDSGADSERVTLTEAVPGGHKIARQTLQRGDVVRKYGLPIGTASADIPRGAWVHDHNLATGLSAVMGADDAYSAGQVASQSQAGVLPFTSFAGYARTKGRPGIRNDIWIIPGVGCINGELDYLAAQWTAPAHITGVKVLSHPFGCSQLGEDLHRTGDVLAGLARNPNAAGVLVVGLGCENLSLSSLRERLADRDNVRFMSLQDSDEDESTAIFLRHLDELADGAPKARTTFPASDLIVGVKCGGSDGYSGLTANPLLGRFADCLVRSGGAVLATEIPEMFGAEPALLPRMASPDVRARFLDLDQWFRSYFVAHNQPVHENPSPGNREGGISTLEEKSLGAVEKSGSQPVVAVLPCGDLAGSQPGVHVLFAPGNDLVSCTALAAAGAQCILFTTGRGTPFGTVVPTLKVSSNSGLAQRHPGWIDFDAGILLQKGDWDAVTAELATLVRNTAEGKPARHERKNIAQIALFKDGVIL